MQTILAASCCTRWYVGAPLAQLLSRRSSSACWLQGYIRDSRPTAKERLQSNLMAIYVAMLTLTSMFDNQVGYSRSLQLCVCRLGSMPGPVESLLLDSKFERPSARFCLSPLGGVFPLCVAPPDRGRRMLFARNKHQPGPSRC